MAERERRGNTTADLSLLPEAVQLVILREAKQMMRFGLADYSDTNFSRTSFSKAIFAMATISMMGASSFAADSHTATMLRGLDPATRFQQACDIEAMSRIGKEAKPYHPDRAITDAVSETKVSGDTMEGAGGAFRSGGKWYQFSFTCRASPDRMKVMFFSYKVGTPIPEGKWEEYGLWR